MLDPLKPYAPDTFGSANFMTRLEAIELKLDQRGHGSTLCPYVGGIADGSGAGDTATMIYARSASLAQNPQEGLRDGSGHLLTVAPTRAGKGTGQIVPNLLRWEGSCIVIDVKGENYKLTSGFRHNNLQSGGESHRTLRFSPFEDYTAVWNPIMSIGTTSRTGRQPTQADEEEDARYLVNLLVTPSGAANDQFWENSAKNFLEGLVLYVRTSELAKAEWHASDDPNYECQVRERSLREVRRLLTLNEKSFQSLIKAMTLSRRTLIRQAGTTMQRLTKGDGRTGNSILAIALEQTSVWAYERLQAATYKPSSNAGSQEPGPNDFEFRNLRDGRTTLYIVVPPDYLTEYRSVLRVLIGVAMREMRRSWTADAQKKPPVLFLLDEFPQLGYMQPIEEALLYLAGYGVRFWFFVQDISQLQLHYPDSWRTFMANTGTQCFFGVSDIATANLVSEMAGTMTVANQSFGVNVARQEGTGGQETHGTSSGPGGSGSNENYTTSWQNSYTEGQSAQVGWVGRRLITPDEVMRMHDEEQIIFMKGLKPLRAVKMPWYKNNSINSLANQPTPYEISFE